MAKIIINITHEKKGEREYLTKKEYIDDIVRMEKVFGILTEESDPAYFEDFSIETLDSLWSYLIAEEISWKKRHKEL